MFRRTRNHRRSLRLRGFDYASPGAYFVTMCTWDRACLFGEVVDGVMRASREGEIACACWSVIPDHFAHVRIDAWVLMPNHVHGVICLIDRTSMVGARHAVPLHTDERQ